VPLEPGELALPPSSMLADRHSSATLGEDDGWFHVERDFRVSPIGSPRDSQEDDDWLRDERRMFSRDFAPKIILKDPGRYASPHSGSAFIRGDALSIRHCLLLASTEVFQERTKAIQRSHRPESSVRGRKFVRDGRVPRSTKAPSDPRLPFTCGYDLLECVVGSADTTTRSIVEVNLRELMCETASPAERFSVYHCWLAVVEVMVGMGGLMNVTRDVDDYYLASLASVRTCSCIGDEASEGLARILMMKEKHRLEWKWFGCVAWLEQWAARMVSSDWDPAMPCSQHREAILSFHNRDTYRFEDRGLLQCIRCGDDDCKNQSCFEEA